MDKLTIYIVRHGKTLLNALNRVQGWCDSPLTEEGIQVAEYLGLGLQDIKLQAAYCSDLRRTRQTAQIVLRSKGQSDLDITEIEGFREAYFGGFEASCNDELWDTVARYMKYRNTDELDADLMAKKITYADLQNTIACIDPMQKAENWDKIELRTQSSLKQVVQKEMSRGSKNILIVAHGQCIAAMLLSLGGDILIGGDIKNASVSKVVYSDGAFNVESLGDMQYVERGKALL